MKLRSIKIKGVRGITKATYLLSDVTLISGPNGSGKTTILGSILFALTGRFPGFPANAHGLEQMERVSGNGFEIVLLADREGTAVSVSRVFKKGKLTTEVSDGADKLTGKAAEARIQSLFGDVSFMASAADPEGSLWGLSREKRKAWASTLCQSAAAWTTERLIKEVGPAELDWDPDASPDAAESMNLNVAKLREAVRDAQAVARQAETVVNTVAVDDLTAPSEADVAKLRDAVREAIQQKEDAVASLYPVRAELAEKQAIFQSASFEESLAKQVAYSLAKGRESGCCPTCGSVASFDDALAAAEQRLHAATGSALLAKSAFNAMERDLALAEQTVREAQTKSVFDAQEKLDKALRLISLVQEKSAQSKVSEEARNRAEQLKALLERVTEARDLMLSESIAPLRVALASLSSLAPEGGCWEIRLDGDALDIGLLRAEGTFVPSESLSSGELFRLSLSMMIARSVVRREPWVGIVFDGFEQVSLDQSRQIMAVLPVMAKAGSLDNVLLAVASYVVPVDGVSMIELGKW